MDSLIQAFGIDIRLITIQIINFTVLAVLLSYFLYKPLLRLVSEREEKIKLGVENAERAEKALDEAEAKKGEILTDAHKDAAVAVARAKESAKEEAASIMAEAEKVASDKVRQGEERGAALAEEALRQSEAEVAKMAVLAAAEVLKEKNS